MKNYKKYMSLFIAGTVLMTSGFSVSASEADDSGKKLQIVTTIFPEYDWVMNILGEASADAEVSMLLDNGVDLHSYQPTADDILKISTCDLFIYVGGESDTWVEPVLQESVNKDMMVINLLDVLGDNVKSEEIVEGMEHEHEHEHDEADEEEHEHDEAEEHDDAEAEEHEHDDAEEEEHEHDDAEEEEHEHDDAEEHEHEHEHESDEHVWLSLRSTQLLCDAIAEALKEADSDNADLYQANANAYKEALSALDAKYTEAVNSASVKTLLFGDRFPFRYLTDDYGLTYYAAFAGCSAETEASFETITFLAQKVDELSLHTIMTIEGTDHRIAETIRENTRTKDQQILSLDSMQATTSKDVENGATYLSTMENNLSVLEDALK